MTRSQLSRNAPCWALLLGLSPALAPAHAQPSQPTATDLSIPFQKSTLPNGLEVIVLEDHSVPLVAVDVWYHVGSGDEVPGRSGFAHLFEHMMFQGTKNTGEDRHFPILQEIGASDVNGTTNPNRTDYYEVVPCNQVETALWLESERMGYLPEAITEKSLDNQREVVRNERRQSYDNVPYGKDRFAVSELLYPEGHPYRHLTIGLHEDIASASVDDVRAFFRKWYVPANATLAIAGDFDPARARALVDKWFGSFPATQRPARTAVPTPTVAGPLRRTVDDNLARLRRVHYAWHSPALFAPGDAELDVLADVLGQPGTGRLYKLLVLDKRWAHDVAVYQASSQLSSTFQVVVDLEDGADLGAVEKAIEDELARAVREPVGDAELHRALADFEARFVWALEPLLARADALQSYNHFLGDPGRIGWDLGRYRRVTAPAVLATAAKYLPSSGRVEVVTMPAIQAPAASAATDGGAATAPAPTATTEAAPAAAASTAGGTRPAADAGTPVPTFPHEAFRAHQPKAGPSRSLMPPGIERFGIGDGIDVYLVERHGLPTIALDLAVAGGATSDPPGKAGRATLCMDLLDDGTEALDKNAFEEAQADVASHVTAWAGNEQQGVSATTLTKNLDRTLDLWSDTLQHPGLRQADHERNVARHVNSVRQSRGAPVSVASRVSGPVFYGPEHPLGHVVTEATTEAVTREDCQSYVADTLRPHGARLYVVGDITRAQVEEKVGARLAEWKGTPRPIAAIGPPHPQDARLYFVDVPGAPQSYVLLAEPGPVRQAPDYVATSVMVGILGGEFSSRINMNLREDKGWSYGGGAYFRYTRDTGMLRAGAGVRADATAGAARELYREIARMAGGAVTAQELAREKNGESLALPGRFATGEEILDTYRELIFFGLPLDYYATYAAKVNAVSAADVAAAARKHLVPADLKVLVVGDGKTVLPALEELVRSKALGEGSLVQLDTDGKAVRGGPASPGSASAPSGKP